MKIIQILNGNTKRVLKEIIVQILKDFPIVVLSGARQVGKSTFLQEEFSEFKYLSMDDFFSS